MKVLIAYAGKTGTTERAAKMLSKRFLDVTLRDLTVGSPNPDDFDAVIVGGSIRMGMLHRDARRWLERNLDVLKTKKFGCFICHGFLEQAPQLIEQNFDEEMLEMAVCVDSFGGELDEKMLRGTDRIITKMIMKTMKGREDFIPCLQTDRIEVFAETFHKLDK